MTASSDIPGQSDGSVQLVDRELTGAIIGAFYDVYNTLGHGFLESVYAAALWREFADRGMDASARSPFPSATRAR